MKWIHLDLLSPRVELVDKEAHILHVTLLCFEPRAHCGIIHTPGSEKRGVPWGATERPHPDGEGGS